MGRTRAIDRYKRLLEVKKLYLKGYSVHDIAETLKVSPGTIQKDLTRISQMYTEMVRKNPYLMNRQMEAIVKHLEQLQMVKKKLWELEHSSVKGHDKVNALKTLLLELEHESKILRLVDSTKVIVKNYIHIDKVNVLMTKIAEIINEFVPKDKVKYAFDRLKHLGEIIDVQPEEPSRPKA